jgi:hypothetical protein
VASYRAGQGWPAGTLSVRRFSGRHRRFETPIVTGSFSLGIRRGLFVVVKNNIKE